MSHSAPHAVIVWRPVVMSCTGTRDEEFIPLLGDTVARSYELRFDSTSQSSQATEGYFKEEPSYEAN